MTTSVCFTYLNGNDPDRHSNDDHGIIQYKVEDKSQTPRNVLRGGGGAINPTQNQLAP